MRELERQFARLARQAAAEDSGAVMPMDGVRHEDDVVLRFDLPGPDRTTDAPLTDTWP
jgi:HSP20 family protein